ncbi:MAG: FprA family A-type flavoprotein [Anaerolineae bacterium]|nr:FprA family A-type flavoprotein [Anaerolineae bacterium]
MTAIEVKSGIYWIGVNDRTTDLFEGLWPITSEGVSYNSYVINDEKSVLVDMAKDIKSNALLDQIAEVVDPADLDYIVVNHMEPDHTGVMRSLRRIAPKAEIFCTKRAEDMLANYYDVTEGIHVVQDGERLELGSHTLEFVSTPMVHWPETMMTYETSQKVLFSCDAFGSYGALQGAVFDDQCNDQAFYERQALRYYANIVALFARPVIKAIEKLADHDISVVAPSHGLIWRSDPMRIVQLYQKWANYALEGPEVGVTLLYGTMYGNTEEMVDAVANGVADAGVPIDIYDVRHIHASYILSSLYSRNGVLIGAPTYEGELFPPMAHVLDIAGRKRIRDRKVAYFGSYGWSGGARREVASLAEELNWDLTESWEFPGAATHAQLAEGKALGYRFAMSLKKPAVEEA